MKKIIITAAAVALVVPALASAQDRGDRGGRRDGQYQGGQYQGAQGQAGQYQRGQYQGGGERGQGGFGNRGGGFGGGGDRNPAPQVQAPAPAPQPAPTAPAATQDGRFDRGSRGGGFQGRQGFQSGQGFQGQQDRRFDGRGDANRDGRYDRGGQRDGRFDNNNRGFDNRGFDNRGYNDGRRFNDNNRGYGRGGGSYNYRGQAFNRFRAQPYRWPGGYRGAFNWRPRQILPSAFLLRDYYIDNYYDYGFGRPPYGYEWIRVGDDALLVNIYSGEIVEVAPGVFYW